MEGCLPPSSFQRKDGWRRQRQPWLLPPKRPAGAVAAGASLQAAWARARLAALQRGTQPQASSRPRASTSLAIASQPWSMAWLLLVGALSRCLVSSQPRWTAALRYWLLPPASQWRITPMCSSRLLHHVFFDGDINRLQNLPHKNTQWGIKQKRKKKQKKTYTHLKLGVKFLI